MSFARVDGFVNAAKDNNEATVLRMLTETPDIINQKQSSVILYN